MPRIMILGDPQNYAIKWQDLIENEKPDQVIFLGDYVDSRDLYNRDLENLQAIIKYKKEHPSCVLILGNHDYAHWRGENIYPFNLHDHIEIKSVLKENIGLFRCAYKCGDHLLCSHAGISAKWMKRFKKLGGSLDDLCEEGFFISEIFKKTEKIFYIASTDWRGDGSTEDSSPIWIRPWSLGKNFPNGKDLGMHPRMIHMVGHTRIFKSIDGLEDYDPYKSSLLHIDWKAKSSRGMCLCDCLSDYFVYDSDMEILYKKTALDSELIQLIDFKNL